MDNQKELIVNFISWVRELHDITLDEWYGPESEVVTEQDLHIYVDDFLEGRIDEN